MTHTDDSAPPLRVDPSPPGIAAPRSGVSCGWGHEREVIEADTDRRLDRRITAWRCPTCARPAFGERIAADVRVGSATPVASEAV